jgi:glycosyltransferase involved in cell wall biosynthesis
VPVVSEDGVRLRRVVFLGHLVPRQGVAVLLEALAILRRRGVLVSADVIGSGPLEADLRRAASEADLTELVRFHGFVDDHADVEKLLAASALGLAPYEPTADSFTRYADPGKLKAYLAAGLPIVLTDVPPNAAELQATAGAEVVAYEPTAIAAAIERGLADEDVWRVRRADALRYVRRYDWSVLMSGALAAIGFEP